LNCFDLISCRCNSDKKLAVLPSPDQVGLNFAFEQLVGLTRAEPEVVAPILLVAYIALAETWQRSLDAEGAALYVLAARAADRLFGHIFPENEAEAEQSNAAPENEPGKGLRYSWATRFLAWLAESKGGTG
jgi:hypothetical protein